MASVETAQKAAPSKKGSRVKKMRRMSVRIDMTPMVDVAFLLLIFFMVSTVFRLPQAMEINLPPESEAEAEIAQSDLLYLSVTAEDSIITWIGFDTLQGAEMIRKNQIPALLEKRKELRGDKLVIVLQLSRKAHYQNMVDLLDMFNVHGTRRYSILPYNQTSANIAKRFGLL